MEGFKREIQTCHCSVHRAWSMEHRASSIFCWFNLSHPAAIKSALRLWILCAISSANVVQKRVKSEFRGIRPLTTNNLLRVHHCLLLVPGTRYWYCSCWVGWPGKDGFTYRYATGIPVPGTRYFTGTRYQVPVRVGYRAVPGYQYLVSDTGSLSTRNQVPGTWYLVPVTMISFAVD
jgi:hypothetical protein